MSEWNTTTPVLSLFSHQKMLQTPAEHDDEAALSPCLAILRQRLEYFELLFERLDPGRRPLQYALWHGRLCDFGDVELCFLQRVVQAPGQATVADGPRYKRA